MSNKVINLVHKLNRLILCQKQKTQKGLFDFISNLNSGTRFMIQLINNVIETISCVKLIVFSVENHNIIN